MSGWEHPLSRVQREWLKHEVDARRRERLKSRYQLLRLHEQIDASLAALRASEEPVSNGVAGGSSDNASGARSPDRAPETSETK